jgi:hypothetical protein
MEEFMKSSKLVFIVIACFSMFFFLACDGGGSSSGGTGTLSASLTDAAGPYQAVYVTVKELQVHRSGDENDEGGWLTLEGFSKKTINLCSLRNGVFEDLGYAELKEGNYSQLRLILCDEGESPEGPVLVDENNEPVLNILGIQHPNANYVVFGDDTWNMLKVPSAINTGVKLVKGFTINAEETTEIILDFDAYRSVVQAGKSGKWLMKPTIKVLSDTQENWILDGTVSDKSEGGSGIEGVLISVQYPDPANPEEIVRTSTLTDENGDYVIYVAPPDASGYHVVAYKGPRTVEEGDTITGDDIWGPECLGIASGEELTNNFVLNNSSEKGIGYITGLVTINNDDIDRYATLSFRTYCPETSKEIEVLSVLIADDGNDYRVVLPVGEYLLVASSGEVVNTPVTIMVEEDISEEVNVVIDIPTS